MRKSLFFAGLAAAATLSFVGCNKEADMKEHDSNFEIVLNNADTRTVNAGLQTNWVLNDELSVFYAPTTTGTPAWSNNTKFKIVSVEDNLAKGTVSLEDGTYDWVLIYPYSSALANPEAVKTDGSGDRQGYMTIGSTASGAQVQEGNSSMAHLAGNNLPVYGVVKGVAAGTRPSVTMNQICSVVKINVTNKTAAAIQVGSVIFTAPEKIVGTYFIDFTADELDFVPSGDNYASSSAKLRVNDGAEIAPNATASFFLGIKPFTASAGSQLSVSITTNNGEQVVSKTISSATTFNAGHIKELNVDYTKAHVESDYEWIRTPIDQIADAAELVIVGTNANGEWAMTNANSTSAAPATSGVMVADSKLVNEPADNIIWTFAKGTNAGEYQFRASAETWLYTTNTNNGVRVGTNSNKFFKLNSGYLYNVATSRYVGIYQDQDWRCYTSINDNIKNQSVAFYVKYDKGTVTPDKLFTAELVGADDGLNLEVPASTVSASIVVNADADVAWTASPSDGLTLNKNSGSGSATIAVSFAANTTTNPINHSVLITTDNTQVEVDEFELCITQLGISTEAKAYPYEETFDKSEGDFTIENTSLAEGLTYVWKWNSYKYMKASAYVGGNKAAVSWLVSPVVDMKTADSPELSFSHCINQYFGTVSEEATVWIKEEGRDWNQLVIPSYPEVKSSGWSDWADVCVDVKSYAGKKVQVGFKYVSTSQHAGTWEVKNFKLDEAVSGPVNPTFTVPSTLSVEVGKTAKINLTTNTDGVVTYTSASTAVATVAADGTVTGVAAGSTTITVAAAATSAYNAASATVAVTVTEAQTGSHYGRVNTITSGKKYLILGGNQSKVLVPPTENGRPVAADVTIEDGKIVSDATTNAYAVTILADQGTYSIVLPNEKYLVFSSSTELKPSSEASDSWTVTAGEQGMFRFFVTSQQTASTVRVLAYRGGTSNCFGSYSVKNINGSEYFDIDLFELGAEPVEPSQPSAITTSISMPGSKTVYLGESFSLNATSNVPSAPITYESEDPAIATVDASGSITGVAEGTVKVYARIAAVEGKYTADEKYCNVTVAKKPDVVDGTWEATALSAIADGAEFVLVSTKGTASYAMSNDNGTSSAPSAVSVTVSGNTISAPASNLVFVLKKVDGGYVFQIKDKDTAVYCFNNNNGLRVGTNEHNVFSLDSESGYLVINDGTQNRFVGVYNNADWRSYTSVNNNIKDQTFTFFVKK